MLATGAYSQTIEPAAVDPVATIADVASTVNSIPDSEAQAGYPFIGFLLFPTKPQLQTPGGFTFQLRWRVDTDSIWTHQGPANLATFGDLGDTVGVRRARIGGQGDLVDWGRYIAEIDLASGKVVPRDVFLARTNVALPGEVRAGHFREPFSLEGATSANTFAFLERSPTNLLDPARNWGLGFMRAQITPRTVLAAGAFHAGNNVGDLQGGDGSTVGFTERVTTAPLNVNDGEQLIHLGFAVSERIPDNGLIIVNQRPQSSLLYLGDAASSPFIPIISLPATYQQLANVQFAAAYKSFWTQAEWNATWIDQTGGVGTVYFHGYHADVGWFITGEHRSYLQSDSAFGPVHVRRPLLIRASERGQREWGWGAWEVVARTTYLDLFDPRVPTMNDSLVGIKLIQPTWGVNWYLCDHTRLMFDYTYALPTEPNTGTSSASVFAMRLNVWW